MARHTIAVLRKSLPKRGVVVLWIEFACLLEISHRVSDMAAKDKIRDAAVEIGRGIIGVELDRRGKVRERGGIVA